VREGKQTRFWIDLWLGDCPFCVEFYQLYNYCRNPNASIHETLGTGSVQIDFRRSLNYEEMNEWVRLVELVSQVQLTRGRDEMQWILENRGHYTTKSLYRIMTFGGVKDVLMKIKFFLWMAFNDRIQSAV
ncbi:hypothetical protein PVAP13_6KG012976, partial [Panicum virgatum]